MILGTRFGRIRTEGTGEVRSTQDLERKDKSARDGGMGFSRSGTVRGHGPTGEEHPVVGQSVGTVDSLGNHVPCQSVVTGCPGSGSTGTLPGTRRRRVILKGDRG